MILIITIGCSQYSSYEECYINELAKMPEGLNHNKRDGFANMVNSFCNQFRD